MTAALSYINRVDAGTLTAGSAASTLPVQNLTDRKVQKPWRALSTSTWFGVDFLSEVSIQLLGLFGANISSTDTVRHRLSAVALGNGELLDTGAVASGVTAGYAATLKLLDAAVSARYWRCDIEATSRASLGTFDVGRSWAGPIISPAIGISTGWTERWADTAERPRAPRSGTTFVSDGLRYRVMRVALDWMTEAEKASIMAMDFAIGRTGQFVFIRDISATLETSAMLATQTDTRDVEMPDNVYPSRFRRQWDLEQEI